MLVIGEREAQAGQVSVRNRKRGDLGVRNADAFLAELQQLIDSKSVSE